MQQVANHYLRQIKTTQFIHIKKNHARLKISLPAIL